MFTFPRAALLLLALPQATPPAPTTPVHPAPGAVVATVDGVPMTAAEVDPYLWDWKSREVIEELVSHRIIAAEAARKNVTASDAEVKARIDEQIKLVTPSIPAGQTLDDFIKKNLGGMSRLALVAKSSVLVDKLAEMDFKPADYVKVATIVFPTTGDSTDGLRGAIKKADSAYAALQAGKSWDIVLRLNETRPEVIAGGGLLGWKIAAIFPDSVQAQFAILPPLGYTKPTQTNNGIQIFRLLAKGATAKPAELAELKKQYSMASRTAIVKRLREAAKVEIK